MKCRRATQGEVARSRAHLEIVNLVVPTLNAGVDYWLAVDCFNGSGVSAGEVVAVPSAVGRS